MLKNSTLRKNFGTASNTSKEKRQQIPNEFQRARMILEGSFLIESPFPCSSSVEVSARSLNSLTSISSSMRVQTPAVFLKSMRMCTTRAKWRRCYSLEPNQSNKVASQWISLVAPYFKIKNKKFSLLLLCPTSWLEQCNCNKLPGFRARISSNWHRFPLN